MSPRTDDGITAPTTRDEMHHAVLFIEHDGCPNTDLTKRYRDVRIQSDSSAHAENDQRKQLLRIETDETDLETFVTAYCDHERVENATFYAHADADHVGHLTPVINYTDGVGISDILVSHGVYYEPTPVAYNGRERWRIYYEDHAELENILGLIRANDNRVQIQKKKRLDFDQNQTPNTAVTDLTARQREVFLAAIAHGYFDIDSETTLETVADDVGLSTSAVWEHLARAKQKILTHVAADMTE